MLRASGRKRAPATNGFAQVRTCSGSRRPSTLGTSDRVRTRFAEFEASLRSNPNRYRSFAGAAKASVQLGNPNNAKSFYEKLVTLGDSADTERPDLLAARQFLAQFKRN